jgi:hypothetical protein
MTSGISAEQFIKKLKSFSSPEELKKIQRYFKSGPGEYGEGDKFIGVRMGQVFTLAKEFIEMPLDEIDKQARRKKTPESRRKELFDLYIRRHDRINNWDLVDLGALYAVGSYLFDKPRDILYKLALSKNIWERRTAIVGTAYFIRQGDVADTFKIAEILLNDKHDLVHKGAGWMLRFAGEKDRQKLLAFLDRYAATMPRTLLRYSIERLDKKLRDHYMGLKKAG